MKTVSAKEAKNRLGEYLEAAQSEPVTITRNGRPFAVILKAEEYERLSTVDDAFLLLSAEK